MSTLSAELVDALKRELAVPGEFGETFPNTTDDDLNLVLADAFSEAQLDGFFGQVVLSPDLNTLTPDLSRPGGMLVVFYAAARVIRSQIRNTPTSSTYKAGPVEYAIQTGIGILKDELDRISQRKIDLLLAARRGAGVTYVFDGYFARVGASYWSAIGGFYPYELYSRP